MKKIILGSLFMLATSATLLAQPEFVRGCNPILLATASGFLPEFLSTRENAIISLTGRVYVQINGNFVPLRLDGAGYFYDGMGGTRSNVIINEFYLSYLYRDVGGVVWVGPDSFDVPTWTEYSGAYGAVFASESSFTHFNP